MAQFEDALTGWEIFRARNGNVSRSQLNAALRARHREPISERTYRHYTKLLRLGYSDYVSINRLDVRHANDSVFDLADRSRYADRELSSPGRLVLPTAADVLTLSGSVGRVSEGYATLRVPRSDSALRAARATKYDKGVLVFEEVGVERAVEVSEAIDRGKAIDLVLAFRSLLATDLVLPESPFPRSTTHFTVDLGSESSLYQVLGTLHTTFDLFESIRGVADVALTATLGENAPPTPTPRVLRLEFSNPFELVLVGAAAVTSVVVVLINRVARSITAAAEAASQVQAVGHARNEERRRKEKHELEMKSLQLDNIKKAVEVADLLSTLRPQLAEVAGVEVPALPPGAEVKAEGLKDQAVEAATELLMGGAEGVQISDEPRDD